MPLRRVDELRAVDERSLSKSDKDCVNGGKHDNYDAGTGRIVSFLMLNRGSSAEGASSSELETVEESQ